MSNEMASAKLFPPLLDGKLPAQVGNTLRIPYQHNRAVGAGDIIGINLKLKTVATDTIVNETLFTTNVANGEAVFENVSGLQVGQYYKAQIAYNNGTTIGYFSTVGVFKYTAAPTVTIENDSSIVFDLLCYNAIVPMHIDDG